MTRSSDAGRPCQQVREHWSTRVGRFATEQPLPWLVAGLVFLANAVLSATRADWWLAALEASTGLLAGISALSVAPRRRPAAEGDEGHSP